MGLAPRYRENSALSEHETKPDGFGLGEREDSPPQECPGCDVLTPRATRASKKKKTSPQIPGQGHFLAGNSSQPAVPQSLSSPGSRLDFISAFRGAITLINSAAMPGERLCL